MRVVDLSTWGFVAFGVAQVLFGTVRANVQVIGPLVILTVAMYPVRLGFATLMRDRLGVDAIWRSFPVALAALREASSHDAPQVRAARTMCARDDEGDGARRVNGREPIGPPIGGRARRKTS